MESPSSTVKVNESKATRQELSVQSLVENAGAIP